MYELSRGFTLQCFHYACILVNRHDVHDKYNYSDKNIIYIYNFIYNYIYLHTSLLLCVCVCVCVCVRACVRAKMHVRVCMWCVLHTG